MEAHCSALTASGRGLPAVLITRVLSLSMSGTLFDTITRALVLSEDETRELLRKLSPSTAAIAMLICLAKKDGILSQNRS
jgi:hypothetical protein